MSARTSSLQAVLERQAAAAAPDTSVPTPPPAPAPAPPAKPEKFFRPSRDGRRFLGGHFAPNVVRQMKMLAAEEDTTTQALLEEALDLLVDGASRILRELTGGQYDLIHDKGEFFVIDHHDAGLRRGVRTLSGGETFQASLALALALSEQLAGMSTTAASLESIVLDEGFGTLDAATLDVVAATLENLAARGDRMVGVVTHVTALAERVPVRFEVHKDARTAHVARVGL